MPIGPVRTSADRTRGRAVVAAAAAAALVVAGCGDDGTSDETTRAEATQTEQTTTTVEQPAGGDDDGATPPEGLVSIGAPAHEVGRAVTFEPVVVEGDDVFVVLTSMTAYRDGVELEVGVRYPPEGEGRDVEAGPGGPMDVSPDDRADIGGDLPDDLLRLGITYPDGRSAWTSDELTADAGGDERNSDVELSTPMGSGDQRSWDQEIWLTPVPEPGDEPLELVLDWPARGIDEQALDLDVVAREIADAAEGTIELWPSG